MSVTRNPLDYHQVMSEHVGHDIHITQYTNHTFMWCRTCVLPTDKDDRGLLFFKTYDDKIQKPVAFPIYKI